MGGCPVTALDISIGLRTTPPETHSVLGLWLAPLDFRAGPRQLVYLCSSFIPSQWPRLPESGRGDILLSEGHLPVPPEAKWLRVAEDRWDSRNDSRKIWPRTQA